MLLILIIKLLVITALGPRETAVKTATRVCTYHIYDASFFGAINCLSYHIISYHIYIGSA